MTTRALIEEIHRIVVGSVGQIPIPKPSPQICLAFLSQAALRASEITQSIVQEENIPVPANTRIVKTRFSDPFRVYWNGQRLYRSFEYGNEPLFNTTTPTRYWLRNQTILLFTTPTSAGTLTVLGTRLHSPINTENDPIELPEDCHLALAWAAAGYYLLAHTEQTQRAMNYIQLAEQHFAAVRNRILEKRMMEIAPDNSLIGWVYQIAHQYIQNYAPETIDAAITQAFNHFFGFFNKIYNRIDIVVPANTQYVELNNQFIIEIYQVFAKRNNSWTPLLSQDIGWDYLLDPNLVGRPHTYFGYGNRLQLYPIPSEDVELRIEGAILPMSNPQQFIPPHLTYSIAEYAAGLLLANQFTEKGQSYGIFLQEHAKTMWQEWRRQVLENEYRENPHTYYSQIEYSQPVIWRD